MSQKVDNIITDFAVLVGHISAQQRQEPATKTRIATVRTALEGLVAVAVPLEEQLATLGYAPEMVQLILAGKALGAV